MGEYLSPGVYVEEYDNSTRTIEGVGTSTAGFTGMAVKGPAKGAPSLITSFSEFRKQFGGYLSEYTHGEYRYLPYSVEQFFVNGGTRCYVSRVTPPDAKAAFATKGVLTVKAANAGKWGDYITVRIAATSKKKIQLVEKTGDREYRAKSCAGFLEGDLVSTGKEINRITGILDNALTFEKEFGADPVDASLIPAKVLRSVEMDMTVSYEDSAEGYEGLTFNDMSPNYIERRLKSSELIRVELHREKSKEKPKAAAGDKQEKQAEPKGAGFREDALSGPVEQVFGAGVEAGVIALSGGADGSLSLVNAGTFIGEDKGPGERTGIQAFLENDVVSIMAVPGITMPEVEAALIAHCENTKSRFAVLDMPREYSKTKEMIDYRGMVDSTYAAMYHPWIQVFDRVTGKPGLIPPSGSVAGVYSRTDISRGVHKAPANEVISGCTGLAVNFTSKEQDILNPEGINLIRSMPGQGIRIWGARTAGSNSAFRYVNVRRLFIFVEESIKANTNWVVFEPNDSALWGRVQMTVSSFLDNLWRGGKLSGSTASEAYFVEIGPTTMSKDDILSGRLICNIGIAPSRPAEFVIFRITQHTAEAVS